MKAPNVKKELQNNGS